MRWLALMPLRGGSKSIPGKNLRHIAGRPLFAWSLEQVLRSKAFERVVVATDADSISAAVKELFGSAVEVIGRSAATATDEASTESVMLEVQRKLPFDVVGLVQATSPLTRARHFVEARERFEHHNWDSLLTAVASRRFYWSCDGRPLNYDPQARPRRQDFAGSLIENGAFYYTRAAILERFRNRLGGKIGIYEMPADTLAEIDEPEDWHVVEQALMAREQ